MILISLNENLPPSGRGWGISSNLKCGPDIIDRHSEEADKIVYQLARIPRPTKNLSYPQARFVFFAVPSQIW